MRATQRITWLLLLTSFLLACSDCQQTSVTNDNTTDTSGLSGQANVTKDKTDASPTAITGATTNSDAQKTTQATTNPTAAVTTPVISSTAKPTEKSATITTTYKPITTLKVTDNQTAASASPSITTTVLNVNANPTTSNTLNPVTTTGRSSSGGGGSAVSSSAPIIQSTKTSVPSVDLSGTSTVATQPGGPGNVGTTKSPQVTNDPAMGQQSTSNTTISYKKSQPEGKGGTEKTTVTVTNQQPSASRAPAGNTGTTSSPSILTKAGTSAAGSSAAGSSAAGSSAAGTSAAGTSAPGSSGSGASAAGTSAPGSSGSGAHQNTINTATVAARQNTFQYSLNTGHEKDEEKELAQVCRRLLVNLQDGNCTLKWRHDDGKVQFDYVEINGKVKTSLAAQYYEEITKKPTDNKTLIAILASCGALLIMIVILAVCASHHRKPYHENQQHLTEELHTVENGYHDNPTLDVMEVQPEMQEKKMALNGEFNDSWIVPIDNLLKEEIPDEEDTHL